MGDFNGDPSPPFDPARMRADEVARNRANEARREDQARRNEQARRDSQSRRDREEVIRREILARRDDPIRREQRREDHGRRDYQAHGPRAGLDQGEVGGPVDIHQASLHSQQTAHAQGPWLANSPYGSEQQGAYFAQQYGYPPDPRLAYHFNNQHDPFVNGYHQNARFEQPAGGYANFPNGPFAYPQGQQFHYQPPSRWQHVNTPEGYVVRDMQQIVDAEPPIPNAVRAIWSRNPNLSNSLENREGGTNVYIRGFRPETTDQLLHGYASRFGTVVNCKAIIDYSTNQCKGFGFVMFENFIDCDNAIRAFTWAGYQASFAQKSRNDRLAALADLTSTNIYCTNIPHWWMEPNLAEYFFPLSVLSVKISRNENGVSKEVGFAKFATRELAEEAIKGYHCEGAKGLDEQGMPRLSLRFADTREQKLLKAENAQRRDFRAYEYSQSVTLTPNRSGSSASQMVANRGFSPAPPHPRNSITPAPTYVHAEPLGRTPDTESPAVDSSVSSGWTPESSMSPSVQAHKKSHPQRPSKLRKSISASGETDESAGDNIKEKTKEDVDIGKLIIDVKEDVHTGRSEDESDEPNFAQNISFDQVYPMAECTYPRRTQSTRRSDTQDAIRPLRPLECIALGDRILDGQPIRTLGLRVRSLGSPEI